MRLHRPADARAGLNISKNRAIRTCLYAVGGNALSDPSKPDGDSTDVLGAVLEDVVDLLEAGYRVVMTHGNGPQVGQLLMMEEAAIEAVEFITEPEGLDNWVAATQGTLGHDIATRLDGVLTSRGRHEQVATLLTRVVVSADDEAFLEPTKPVGPVISEQAMSSLPSNWVVKHTAQGNRRVVASPEPLEILDVDAIAALVDAGAIVLACGGGGIPVIIEEDGLAGVDAVIDKDRVSSLLARALAVDLMVISTGVDSIRLNFGAENEKSLRLIAAADLTAHLAQGQFPAGSMGPKVEALLAAKIAIPSMEVLLCQPGDALSAVRGLAGTTVEA
jgi:carbamate kinase